MHPYSQALLDVLKGSESLENAVQEVRTLENLLQEQKDFLIMLDHPVWSVQERREIVETTLQGFDPALLLFMEILAQERKSREFFQIADGFYELARADLNIVPALVKSAFELDEASRQRLIRALEKRLGKQVEAEFALDPSLIGGIQIIADGQIIDNSVAGKLDRLGEMLKEGQG